MAEKSDVFTSFNGGRESVDFSPYADVPESIFSSNCHGFNEAESPYQSSLANFKIWVKKYLRFWILFTLLIASSFVFCIVALVYCKSVEEKITSMEWRMEHLKASIEEKATSFNQKLLQNQVTNNTDIIDDHNNQLLKIKNSVENNDKELEYLRKDANQSSSDIMDLIQAREDYLNAVLFVTSNPINTECGGIIPLQASASASVFIRHSENTNTEIMPSHNNSKSSTHCVWTIQNSQNFARSILTVTLRYALLGYPSSSVNFYAFEWNRDQNMTSTKIENRREYRFNSQALFISFAARTERNTAFKRGFILQISVSSVLTDSQPRYGSNLHFTSVHGNRRISTHRDVEVDTIVIHSKGANEKINFSVDLINTEICCDWLFVYEIGRNGTFMQYPRMSGTNASTPLSFSTSDPILAVFTTDGSAVVEGFQISWTKNI